MTSGRALFDDGVGDRDLVGNLTGLLDARSDAANQLSLLAVASEVGQLRAAIASQSSDEAVQRALGNVRKLSVGQAGGNEGNQSVGELHLVDIIMILFSKDYNIACRKRQSMITDRKSVV